MKYIKSLVFVVICSSSVVVCNSEKDIEKVSSVQKKQPSHCAQVSCVLTLTALMAVSAAYVGLH